MSAIEQQKKNPRNKGRNFNKDDDRAICRSWIAVSGEPTVGTNQTSDEFGKT